MELAEARREFPDSVRGYLDTPSMGIAPRATRDRIRAALDEWHAGTAEFARWEDDVEECRLAFAGLLGVDGRDVGVLPSVVPAALAVAEATARRGGVVVAHRTEFRSLLLPFLGRVGEDRIRWVDGPYTAERFVAAVDRDVTTVVMSTVSSADGARPDLAAVVAATDGAGASVVVDATQSVGVVRLPVAADRLGALLCAGYKGLLGPRGTAYAYLGPAFADAAPVAPSPYGMADAPEVGSYGPPLLPKPGAPGLDQSPAWLSWVGALPALRFLAATAPADREAHATGLAALLRDRLAELGLHAQCSDLPSPVLSVAVPDPARAADALRRHGVRAAARNGRLRFGVHLYNLPADVDRAADVLATTELGKSPSRLEN